MRYCVLFQFYCMFVSGPAHDILILIAYVQKPPLTLCILMDSSFWFDIINLRIVHCTYLYLRNLLTHTVNNSLQKLNYVKHFQYSVVKQKFNIIHTICENFRTIPWVLCKIQLI